MHRILKQLLFAILFLAVLGGIGFGVYKWTRPAQTCFDKIQNQSEEGVDCGPICGNACLSLLKPIEIKNSYLFAVGQLDYDALFRVSNSNPEFGSPAVIYELNVFDDQNVSILTKTGTFYILPGQTKYIYEPALKTKSPASRAELKITNMDWEKLSGVFAEDGKFVVKAKDYSAGDRPGVSARVSGTISNASDFGFDKVDVVGVLFKNSEPFAASRTVLTTFPSKTDRFYEITWANPIDTPDRIDIEATTNVFEDSNFLRKYGAPEKFQQP